jgi:radical SAM superfamily enzyme YgiQ (UPF0313 family)
MCAIAKRIKFFAPLVKIIAGGSHVSHATTEALENKELDYIVVGEGEKAAVHVVDNVPEFRVIQFPLMTNLDENVLPARHLIDYSKYSYPIPGKGLVRMDAIESSRGCPFGCNFCTKRRTKYRLRTPELVVDEIEESHLRNGVKFFMFFDDTFTIKKSYVKEVCEEIVSRGLHKRVDLYVNTQASTTTREMLEQMRAANVSEISMGVETGSEKILKESGKGTKKHQYVKIYNWMRELGYQTRGSFIVGFPNETHETVMETINFARELNLMRATCNIMTPYPGTRVYHLALQEKGIRFIDKERDWSTFKRWGSSTIETDELTKKDLEYYQKLFLTLFYSQRKVIWYHVKQLFRGNFSHYYYRPVLYAIKNRVRLLLGRTL